MKSEGSILVVDDDPGSLELLAKILGNKDYQVYLADSGELALAAVTANPPDLILLDIDMKDMNGFEVCRRLKACENTQHIPIIFISAHAEMKQKIEGFKLGAVDYITKPFQIDELLIRVSTQMALSLANVSIKQQASELNLINKQLQLEIEKRKQIEKELQQNLNNAERSRKAILSTLEDQKRAEKTLRMSEELLNP
ncbi:MAG: response regulator [bacterium]